MPAAAELATAKTGSSSTHTSSLPHASGAAASGKATGVPNPAHNSGEGLPVTGPVYDAAYLNNPRPPYPAAARRLKLQGTAVVRVLVSPAGLPEKVALEKSSGARILDDAAMEAVQHWSFAPARRGDRPIAAEVDVPVRFLLN